MTEISLISLIIPTYNGKQKVIDLLQHLLRQTYNNFEVIVVIDGSSDGTYDAISALTYPFSLKIVQQSNKGRSGSRNAGAKHAKGSHILFFDDDVRPEPECIASHVQFHSKTENTLAVGGIFEDPALCQTDIQKFKEFLSRKWTSMLPDNETPLTKKNLYLSAANLSIPLLIFNTLEGFDESLTDAEDLDLGIRAYMGGYSICFLPQAKVWHDDFITMESYIRRSKDYTRSHEKLITLKPVYHSFIEKRTIPDFFKFKKPFYYLFSLPFWEIMIDKNNFLIVLPRLWRYKIYEWIIVAKSLYYK